MNYGYTPPKKGPDDKRVFSWRARFLDPSLWGIIAGNLLCIYLADLQNWSIFEVMWVYWLQSVIIGFIAFKRMRALKNFSSAGMTANNRPIPETSEAARKAATFFAVHYGFFHLIYAAFIGGMSVEFDTGAKVHTGFVFLAAFGFLISHAYSFRHNFKADTEPPRPALASIMFMPYLRVIPMHITIIFGFVKIEDGDATSAMVLFMALKTAADAVTHIIEHHIMQSRNSPTEMKD